MTVIPGNYMKVTALFARDGRLLFYCDDGLQNARRDSGYVFPIPAKQEEEKKQRNVPLLFVCDTQAVDINPLPGVS